MPKRKEVIVPGEIYHVYNKSAGSENIFSSTYDVNQALRRIRYFKFLRRMKYVDFVGTKENFEVKLLAHDSFEHDKPLIEIYSHSIMPNHYHFVLKELISNGLTSFISNFQKSFARLYNAKNNRIGVAFQGRFKVKHIVSTEQLIHVVRYVHLNPVTAHMFEFSKLSGSERTSYKEYLNLQENKITDTEFILKQFSNIKSFIDFHKNQVDYQRKLASIKKILLD